MKLQILLLETANKNIINVAVSAVVQEDLKPLEILIQLSAMCHQSRALWQKRVNFPNYSTVAYKFPCQNRPMPIKAFNHTNKKLHQAYFSCAFSSLLISVILICCFVLVHVWHLMAYISACHKFSSILWTNLFMRVVLVWGPFFSYKIQFPTEYWCKLANICKTLKLNDAGNHNIIQTLSLFNQVQISPQDLPKATSTNIRKSNTKQRCDLNLRWLRQL